MSLGHLVLLIQHVLTHWMTTRTALRDLKDKLTSVNQLSSNELAAFLSSDSRLVRTADQRSLVAEEITKGIAEKEHQSKLCVQALESASFVLWRHLDHFVHTPQTQRIGKKTSTAHVTFHHDIHLTDLDPLMSSKRSTEPSWYGSEDAIEKLKKDTRACFNEVLFRKLDGVEATLEEDKQGVFFGTLNRRLKRIANLYT